MELETRRRATARLSGQGESDHTLTDLFGQWVAVRSWGRIDTRWRSAQACVAEPRDAMTLARRWLKDRDRA